MNTLNKKKEMDELNTVAEQIASHITLFEAKSEQRAEKMEVQMQEIKKEISELKKFC